MPDKLRELLLLAGIPESEVNDIIDISYFVSIYIQAKAHYEKPNMPFSRLKNAIALGVSLPELTALKPYLKALREAQTKRLEDLNEQAKSYNEVKS